MRIRSICRWLAVAALALLTGCASSIATREPDGRLSVQIPKDSTDGYVLVKVVSIRPISLLNPKWQQITLMSGNGVRHEMPDVTPMVMGVFGGNAVPTESLHFGRLPPGTYDFANAGSTGPGPGLLMALIMSDHAALGKQVPRFKVESGRLANLGTIVFAPATGDKDAPQLVLLGGPKGTAESLRMLQDDSGETPLPPTGGGWLQTSPPETDAIARSRTFVSMLTTPASVQNDGRLVAGTHLGEIVERVAPGRWQSEPLEDLFRLNFAARWNDGTWVAGSEFGRYAIKRQGGSWEPHRLTSERGQVVAIQSLPDGQTLLVVTDRVKGARVLVQQQLGADATPPRELAVDIKDPDEARLPVMLLDHPDTFLIARNIPGFRRESIVTRIDKRSLQVTTSRQSFWFAGWQVLPGGDIIVTRVNGMSNYLTNSTDAGSTWKNTERTLPHGMYWVDRNRGYAITPSPGFSTVGNQVTQTTDGGKTWTPLGRPFLSKDFAARIVFADDQEILAEGGNMLFSSVDAGKNWAPTFPRSTSAPVASATRR